jgi:hypothetical protein
MEIRLAMGERREAWEDRCHKINMDKEIAYIQ